jgi:hypothetical protein
MQKEQIDHVQERWKQRKRLDQRSYELWTNINVWTNIITSSKGKNTKHYISNMLKAQIDHVLVRRKTKKRRDRRYVNHEQI